MSAVRAESGVSSRFAGEVGSEAPPAPERSTERAPAATAAGVPWKMRLEDPMNRYYRYPVARWLVRGLLHTPITPNQITFAHPLFAALAGYLVTFDDPLHLALGALAFEARSILDCADGVLARAKNMSSPTGHAIDAAADWLGVVFLYIGIFWHFHLHPPTSSAWSAYISTNGVLAVALFQAATRSFAADYYKVKFCSIFETGQDETVEALRRKVLALGPASSFFAHFDVFIGRMGHLSFEHEWFDAERSRSSTTTDHVKHLVREENAPLTRLIALSWAISNGDAFLSLVIVTLLLNQLWAGQIFFATAGLAWIFGVIFLSGWFVRSATRRALAVA
jgi:phosphatidylglycerophosphate synthase